MMTGVFIGFAGSLAVFLLLFGLYRIRSNSRNTIASMQRSTVRLRQVVAELMARADEVDQESKYLGGELQPDLSQRLAKACSDLVLLGDAVKVIETRLEQRDVDSAKKDLLISLGAANQVTAEINEIREEIRRKRICGS